MNPEENPSYAWQVYDRDRWVTLQSDSLPSPLKSKKSVIRAFSSELEATGEDGVVRRYRLVKIAGGT